MAIVNPWGAYFNNGQPIGTDPSGEGDNRILDTRETIRDVLRVEHDVGDASVDPNYTDSGRHITGSARAFFRAAAPTMLLEPTNAGAWPPVLQNNDRNTGLPTLDNGRLWIDFDDCQLYFREQVITGAAWTDINTNYGVPGPRWISLWPRSWSVLATANVANETPAVDDTRVAISGLTASVTVPDDGRAYEIAVEVKVRFAINTGAEQVGFWLEETVPVAADRDLSLHYYRDTTDVTGEAVLTHLETAPVNGTVYTYVVDMACSTFGDLDVNPTTAAAGGWNGNVNVDFAAQTAWSKMTVHVRPRYLTATYLA